MLTYKIGTSRQKLLLSDSVLNHFEKNRQYRFWNRESGGHIFSEVDGNEINVVYASGPNSDDFRSRLSFSFRKDVSQKIIDEQFIMNRHYIGDWHTHPQDIPWPSPRDYRTMASRFFESKHRLRSLVFIIVGRREFPLGLAVIIHNGNQSIKLDLDGSYEIINF